VFGLEVSWPARSNADLARLLERARRVTGSSPYTVRAHAKALQLGDLAERAVCRSKIGLAS